MIITIIVFIFILGILVFVHELGHYLAAKKVGIKVEEFAFGFPPKIYKKKVGETEYAINAIPIGGYVKLYGEEGANEKDERSFAHKTIFQRFLVIFAGVLFNFITAWILFVIGYNFGLPVTTINPENVQNAKVENQIIISNVLEKSTAEKAGIESGDTIIAIDNQEIEDSNQLSKITKEKKGEEVTIKIKRFGQDKILTTTLAKNDLPLGIEFIETQTIKVGFFQSFWLALKEIFNISVAIIVAVYEIIKALFTPSSVPEGVAGPIGILFLFKNVLRLGMPYIIQFTAFISINFAILNFLPFPALDGGRFIFLLIEFFRKGKKVDPKTEAIVHSIGFMILILLMILITYRDVVQNLIK